MVYSVQMLHASRLLLSALILGAALVGCAGCSYRMKTRPLTPNIVHSREICREANTAMELGRWNEAEKKLEKAVKLNPKEVYIRRHYAEVLWQQKKHQESLKQLEDAIQISRKEGNEDGTLCISVAEKYLDLGLWDAADRFVIRAINAAPQEYKCWTLRAKMENILAEKSAKQGKDKESLQYSHKAMSDYYRALALVAPESEEMRQISTELGTLQMKLQQPQKALAIWQNLEQHYLPNPLPIALLQKKSETLLQLGRTEEAFNVYRKEIEAFPERSEFYVELAETQLHCGRTNDALNTIQMIQNSFPEHDSVAQLREKANSLQHKSLQN